MACELDGSVIGACTLINKDVPPYSIAYGIPKRVVSRDFVLSRYPPWNKVDGGHFLPALQKICSLKFMKIITKLLSILSSFRIFHCNCCGRIFSPCYKNSWGDFICLSCGSSIRSRLLLACLQYIHDLSYIQLVWNKCILHCAPEKPTIKYLSAHSGSYVKADYSVSRYKD